jgi:hypothetical protein
MCIERGIVIPMINQHIIAIAAASRATVAIRPITMHFYGGSWRCGKHIFGITIVVLEVHAIVTVITTLTSASLHVGRDTTCVSHATP